ncbi:MAG: hemolysin III [Saprospiraceae bacterium]|jgi:hemolysin III
MKKTVFQAYNEVERANALTHGFGFIMSLIATYFLAKKGIASGDEQVFWGLTIFGASLCILYLASTLYHSIPFDQPGRRAVLRRVDHIAIYFLIAGTHTPFLLLFLPSDKAVLYLSIIWGMVLLGTLYKLFFFDRWSWVSTVFYVLMGWFAVVTMPQMSDALPQISILWVAIGGLFYTGGVFFYVREKMKWHHVIWHLFVMAGSAGHFIGVWFSV